MIWKINNFLNPQQSFNDCISIGLLDLFGYEDLIGNNSLEQMLINYANDSIHKLYIDIVFKDEQHDIQEQVNENDYEQKFKLLFGSFEKDNSALFFIDNIIPKINEYKKDESLLNYFKKELETSDKKYKNTVHLENTFRIRHSAKSVHYNIKNFIIKNKDEPLSGIKSMKHSNELISSIVLNDMFIFGLKNKVEKYISASNSPKKVSFSIKNDILSTHVHNNKSISEIAESKFLGPKFNSELKHLIKELKDHDISFIKCIKPNDTQQKNYFMSSYVLRQLKYLGILDIIEIRKKCYDLV